MADISPATDEQIAAWERQGIWQGADTVFALIARIRQEQANYLESGVLLGEALAAQMAAEAEVARLREALAVISKQAITGYTAGGCEPCRHSMMEADHALAPQPAAETDSWRLYRTGTEKRRDDERRHSRGDSR